MVDPRASSGFASCATAYDRARPSYPRAAVARVAEHLGLGTESVALDLAAGTGKLTRLVEPLVGRVVAVEPSDDMRASLQRSSPQVEVRDGTAEDLPLSDASVDGVLVAEAFHWFRPTAAATEIARVLRPHGGLALLFNRALWSAEANPWLLELRALLEPHRAAAGGPWPSRPSDCGRALDGLATFGPATRGATDHVQRLSPDDFVALVSSWSWVANLPRDERSVVLDRVRELVGDRTELPLHYVTETWAARLR